MSSCLVRITQVLRTRLVLVLAALGMVGCPSPAPPPQLPAPEFEPARPLDEPSPTPAVEQEALPAPPPQEPLLGDAGVTDAEPESGQEPPAS
ncbi:MAG: hypothetical protein CVU63_19825 [Deltaproteobacteria bacterium HGW-Deltaproteobacteria-20]|nr:MAG: hypothetical protein CVU63_19825 [Deltaproteobacteria bacterium HGW-Deltaproteobacteria-20]